MPSTLKSLCKRQLVRDMPSFLSESIQYEVTMGSEAYGVSSGDSDCDIYSWCIPDREIVFPHLSGEIEGFGRQKKRFEVWQQHHIEDAEARGGRGVVYDFQVYNIVKYFHLVMMCNPNMVDSLFVPERCIRFITPVGQIPRERRKEFLNKKAWHTFKGYAYQQLHKAKSKEYTELANEVREFEKKFGISHDITYPDAVDRLRLFQSENSEYRKYLIMYKRGIDKTKRFQMVKQFGADLKFMYHVVRLLNEIEQIMEECDLDIERSREQLKSVRRGEWSIEQIEKYFQDKERQLEELYRTSKISHEPNENNIKNMLLDCLEQHFGNISNAVTRLDKGDNLVRNILQLIKDQGYS